MELVQPGRIGADPDHAVARGELHEPQQAAAAVGIILIIGHQRGHAVAIEDIRAGPFAVHMAGKHEEEVGVGPEGVVDGRALRAQSRGRGGTANVVAHHHGQAVRVGAQKIVGPVEHQGIRVHVKLQIDGDEIQAAGAEEVEVVVVVRSHNARRNSCGR